MPIVKDYPTENFVQVHNETVRDQSVSFEARGVLVYLLSRSETWNPCISDIAEQGNLGLNKTKRILAELEAAGYIKKSQPRSGGNRFGSVQRTVYGRVYSGPTAIAPPETICVDSRSSGTRAAESRATEPVAAGISTTKERELKKELTKEIQREGEKKKRFSPPTQQEVEDHMLTKGADFDQARSWAEDFVDFYASKDWMVGKNKMKSWTHAASRWAKQNREKSNGTSVRNSKTSGTSIEHTATDTSWGGTWPN